MSKKVIFSAGGQLYSSETGDRNSAGYKNNNHNPYDKKKVIFSAGEQLYSSETSDSNSVGYKNNTHNPYYEKKVIQNENGERSGKFVCECCDFICNNKSNYTVHLSSKRHARLKMEKNSESKRLYHRCEVCGFSSLNKGKLQRHLMSKRHVKKMNELSNVDNENKALHHDSVDNDSNENIYTDIDNKNSELMKEMFEMMCIENKTLREESKELKTILKDLIQHTHDEQSQSQKSNQVFQTQTLQNNQEFQTMMLNLFKECMQKSANMAPSVGNNNTITNSNNTNNINYYLNVTCKDAETDLDFLEQWKERCIELFHEKKLLMAERKISFPNMCTDAYFTQIKSKPQTQRFIQTTNWKDGRVYVNTARLDEDKNPTGESEFILHEDGLQEVNTHMSHALGQSILKLANKEVEEKYFEENRKFNIFSRQPTTPEIEWKRDMTGGLMIGTSEVFNVVCSSTARTKIMKETHKALR